MEEKAWYSGILLAGAGGGGELRKQRQKPLHEVHALLTRLNRHLLLAAKGGRDGACRNEIYKN